jgi:hypothetical protein
VASLLWLHRLAVNFTTGVFFNKIHFAEWVVVAMLIVYIAMILSCYKVISKDEYAQQKPQARLAKVSMKL